MCLWLLHAECKLRQRQVPGGSPDAHAGADLPDTGRGALRGAYELACHLLMLRRLYANAQSTCSK
jgi:hypothetical protein